MLLLARGASTSHEGGEGGEGAGKEGGEGEGGRKDEGGSNIVVPKQLLI